MDKISGLPAHPLLVHIPVVLVPLAVLGTIVIAVSRKMRDRLGWIVAPAAAMRHLQTLQQNLFISASAFESAAGTSFSKFGSRY